MRIPDILECRHWFRNLVSGETLLSRTKHIIATTLLVFMLCLSSATHLRAQVIDELTIHTGEWVGCGADSSDFYAQSFIADVWKVSRIGVWLRKAQPNAFVRISLAGDRGGLPAVDSILFESTYVNPSDSGQLYVYSALNEYVVKDQKYWILVDGYLNPAAAGYAAVGTSGTYTDSFEPLMISENGGSTWTPLAGTPMSMFVEGDTCTFPVSLFNGGTTVCEDATPLTLNAGSGFAFYDWSTGDTTASISVSTSGVFFCTVVDSAGCVGLDTVTITVNPSPDPGLPDTTMSCFGLSSTLMVSAAFDSYLWNNGATASFISAPDTGLYWVSVTDFNGCTARDSTLLRWYPATSFSLGSDTAICDGEVVFFSGPGNCPSYTWSNGDSVQNIFVTTTTSLWLVATDSNNCTVFSDTVLITVNPIPPVPVIVQTDSLLSTAFFAGYNYAWTWNGILWPGADSATFVPDTNGVVTVIVTDNIGCTSQSVVFDYVEPGDTLITTGFVPSGFSPNGDGVNDVFYIPDVADGLQLSLTVVNRWGETVYSIASYQNQWGGTNNNGEQLPDGNYYFKLEYTDGKSPRQGVVLINR